MSKANVKLQLAFDFDLTVPASLLESTHDDLCKTLSELLGAMVFQGMPTVTSKQLGKAGISILTHHHHLNATEVGSGAVDREALIAAAPHLTDDELAKLARRAQGKVSAAGDGMLRLLRREALAMVSEYRMIPCKVEALLTSGNTAQLGAQLNLTNGSVLVDELDRQKRLKADQALTVLPLDTDIRLQASCAGHTLSGPVIEVLIAAIATHRNPLVQVWQRHANG